MSKRSNRVCFCFRRRFRLEAAEVPKAINTMFEEYSHNGIMNVYQFRKFLVEIQKQEKATLADAQTIMNSTPHIFHRKGFNLETFFKYLFGDTNTPLHLSQVHHDMTAPLSHYFVFSGHNSYLTGDLLTSSNCSDVPIIEALERGVRVIELDIWPNSNKDDVIVIHGRSLTTPVDLIKCFKSIKDYAFSASEYPVIITLEDHLTTDLRAKVAKMIIETFGDMLFAPATESLAELPSPESLRRRIVISTKPRREFLKSTSIADDHDLDQDDECAPEYRNLIAIPAGKGKGGLDGCLKVDPAKVTRLSLSEQELGIAAITHGQQIVRFTQRNILRVYPKGTRLDSSNYNPLIGWMHGAQMVAFNMQGYGEYLWLMQGMFKSNGGCGYVKKPNLLMNSDSIFDPKETLPVKTTLKVILYMGEGWYSDFSHTHFDKYSPPDFYTRVGIFGVPADTNMNRTKVLEDDWIPAWNEVFEFPLTVPELALLRIEVREYEMLRDNFGGQTCLPISELREGIRSVPLYNQKGERFNSVRLLMHFNFC